jgi:hypothetical protein
MVALLSKTDAKEGGEVETRGGGRINDIYMLLISI